MNNRKSLVDEMAEWQAPKRERTKPCPNKLWKKEAKVRWRFLATPAFFSEKKDALLANLRSIALRSNFLFRDHAWHRVFPENIYGRRDAEGYIDFENHPLDLNQKDWWHPPKGWDWVWASPATEDAPAVRIRQPLDPGRLP